MSQNIESLWSPDIKATVMSPLTILKGQAEALALQTNGVLLAEITPEEIEEGRISLSFDLVAPALHGSRHRIMKVLHTENLPYPAWIEAEVFDDTEIGYVSASSDHEFIRLVKKVLRSSPVLSVAQSLVARANEVLNATVSVQ
jgi:hypothetical protein